MIGPSGGGRVGAPSLALSEPQLRLVLHVTILACRMARPAVLAHRAAGAKVDENTISLLVMQRIVAIQHRWEIEGFEFTREAILDSALGSRPKVLGRIDFKVKFAHQLGRYGAYFGVESKRIAPKRSALARYYVATGVGKFASGIYGTGHPAGLIVGYVIAASAQALPTGISARVLKAFPGSTALQPYARTYRHATVVEGLVPRNGTSPVRLIHTLIRMHA